MTRLIKILFLLLLPYWATSQIQYYELQYADSTNYILISKSDGEFDTIYLTRFIDTLSAYGVGTTTDTSFFKRNTLDDGIIDKTAESLTVLDNGNVGVGAASPSAELDILGKVELVDNNNNLVIGSATTAASLTAASIYNFYLGDQSGADNIIGDYNVAIGRRALQKNTNSNNLAIGTSALRNNITGYNNTAIGVSAGISATGYQNIYIGNNSGTNSTGNNNIMLGFAAGQNETGSDKLYIEPSSSTTPLIYGDFSLDSLSINGSLSVTDIIGSTPTNLLAIDANSHIVDSGVSVAGMDTAFWKRNTLNDGIIDKTAESLTVLDGGNVGIGTDIPSRDLDVRGIMHLFDSGNNVFIAGGNTTVSGAINNAVLGRFAASSLTSGDENMAIGYYAMQKAETAGYNVAIGGRSLENNVSSNNNIAIGYYAGNATTNEKNTFIGANSGRSNITGTANVYIGYQSGRYNTDSQNTAIGTESAFNNISGIGNTIVGWRAGYNSLGTRNVFIGYQAGHDEAGDYKLYIDATPIASPLIYGDFVADSLSINGSLSVTDITGSTPTNLLAIDANSHIVDSGVSVAGMDTAFWKRNTLNDGIIDKTAESLTVLDNGNVGVGVSSPGVELQLLGRANIADALGNTFIGSGAGNETLTGTGSVGLGTTSLSGLTSGLRNVALGDLSGQTVTTGSNNFFMGYAAGYLSNPDHSIYIGSGGGTYDAGSYNIGLGRDVLDAVGLVGSHNIALGYGALTDLSTGTGNIALGFRGLYDQLGSYSIAIGYQSGYLNQTADYNINIGYRSGYNNLTGDDNIFLGKYSGYSETGSNKLYIENTTSASPLIYGDFSADSLRINGSLSVTDITGSTPTNLLAIDGNDQIVDSGVAVSAVTDDQDLTLVGNTLAIENDPNTDVDLSGYLDNTDTQGLSASQVASDVALLISGGTAITLDAGANITLTETGGNNISIASAAADGNNYPTSFGWATGTGILTLNRSGLGAITIDLDGRYLTSYTESGWDAYLNGVKQDDITANERVGFDEGTDIDITYDGNDYTISYTGSAGGANLSYTGVPGDYVQLNSDTGTDVTIDDASNGIDVSYIGSEMTIRPDFEELSGSADATPEGDEWIVTADNSLNSTELIDIDDLGNYLIDGWNIDTDGEAPLNIPNDGTVTFSEGDGMSVTRSATTVTIEYENEGYAAVYDHSETKTSSGDLGFSVDAAEVGVCDANQANNRITVNETATYEVTYTAFSENLDTNPDYVAFQLRTGSSGGGTLLSTNNVGMTGTGSDPVTSMVITRYVGSITTGTSIYVYVVGPANTEINRSYLTVEKKY